MKKDYLKYTDYQISQEESLFKVNSDTVCLGLSFDSLIGKSLLDIGSNNGALLLYGLKKGAKTLYAIEKNKKCLNTLKNNLESYCQDYKIINSRVQDVDDIKVDVIVCNPPFFEMNNVTEDQDFMEAMFEKSLPLTDLFKAYRRLMKDNGEVYMIYPSDRFPELYQCILEHKMKIMKMRFVHDENKEFASRVILKLKIGKMTKLRVLRPMFIKCGNITT